MSNTNNPNAYHRDLGVTMRVLAGNEYPPTKSQGHPDWQLPDTRHWEITSYEWNERTGYAKFQYTHRRTGELLSRVRWQPNHWTPQRDVSKHEYPARKGKRS